MPRKLKVKVGNIEEVHIEERPPLPGLFDDGLVMATILTSDGRQVVVTDTSEEDAVWLAIGLATGRTTY
jgi:hypothetical protein